MDLDSKKIAILAKETAVAESSWTAPFRVFQTALQQIAKLGTEVIYNFDKARIMFKSIQDRDGISVTKFIEFDRAVMKGYEEAGLNTADASEVVVMVIVNEMGHMGAAKLLNDLEKDNTELFRRTQTSLYRYWRQIDLSLSQYEAGLIESVTRFGPHEFALQEIVGCFSDYFKYADKVVGREESSAYKALMEIVENVMWRNLDSFIKFVIRQSQHEIMDDGRRIAINYLKNQYDTVTTPVAIIKTFQSSKMGPKQIRGSFAELNCRCSTHGAVNDKAKWLIDKLTKSYDKELFIIMESYKSENLCHDVLRELSVRWKNDQAYSTSLVLEFIESFYGAGKSTAKISMDSSNGHELKTLMDLAIVKPVPSEIKDMLELYKVDLD
ncbi:hypothetical protein CCR75_004204 [Bremia lactucae]|uniref:Uncharacterized protein n=1 Tax=Bremia lactucae TaxID=4779 RepID=A0A976FKM1_BRELC|nr:hypothetical protein CCR75_004204 [Bremia lactucae]